jgi:GTPase
VERTRLLIHLLDGATVDPLADWQTINAELQQFNERLAAKPQIVVLNKMDLPDAQAWWPLVREAMEERDLEAHAISAVTGQGVHELMRRVYHLLQELPPPEEMPREPAILRPAESEDAFTIEREADAWRVRGVRVERVAAMTPFVIPEAVARFQRQLRAMGVEAALEEAGVRAGRPGAHRRARAGVAGVSGRVGVLGGTFDPIHHAHLVAAQEALHSLALDCVLLVPRATRPTSRRGPSRPRTTA